MQDKKDKFKKLSSAESKRKCGFKVNFMFLRHGRGRRFETARAYQIKQQQINRS
jgi:hypothetical protein